MARPIFPITRKEAEKQGLVYSSQVNKNALFPSQLRELREKKGVSQAVLASELGVSKSTIGLYETGDTLPDAKTLYDLAVYFGVSADYLLGLTSVQSSDLKMREICEYIGLSEQAIDYLHETKEQYPDHINSLNLLFECVNFRNSLYCIYKYIDSINRVESLLNYKRDKIEDVKKRGEDYKPNPQLLDEINKRRERADLDEYDLSKHFTFIIKELEWNEKKAMKAAPSALTPGRL